MSAHLVTVAPVSSAIAESVVCAAFSPRRKSLSLYVEKMSVGWCHCGSQPAPICSPRSFSRRLIAGTRSWNGSRVRVRHVLADARRIVGRVLLVRRLEEPRELLRAVGHLRRRLELDVHVRLRALLGRHRAVRRAACRDRTSSCRAGSCRATSAPDTSPSPRAPPSPGAPRAARRRRARRSSPVSSLFQRTKRIERSVFTSGLLKTRASSITSAVPEPSSFAASPQPWPSMWPPTMYISSGCVVPTFVQYTSWRWPSVAGCGVERAQLRGPSARANPCSRRCGCDCRACGRRPAPRCVRGRGPPRPAPVARRRAT